MLTPQYKSLETIKKTIRMGRVMLKGGSESPQYPGLRIRNLHLQSLPTEYLKTLESNGEQ